MADEHAFLLEFAVRDYECDLQGIVNNAVYQNYLEHTRHEFLRFLGIDFSRLHTQGTDPVVSRIEIDYISPLSSADKFLVTLDVRRRGRLRFVFDQQIVTIPDSRQILRATVSAVFVRNGRPIPAPQEVLEALGTVQGFS